MIVLRGTYTDVANGPITLDGVEIQGTWYDARAVILFRSGARTGRTVVGGGHYVTALHARFNNKQGVIILDDDKRPIGTPDGTLICRGEPRFAPRIVMCTAGAPAKFVPVLGGASLDFWRRVAECRLISLRRGLRMRAMNSDTKPVARGKRPVPSGPQGSVDCGPRCWRNCERRERRKDPSAWRVAW
jgi:hypothetical protein